MVRRAALVGLVALGLAGCEGAFRGHEDVVARVGDQELTVERLAAMLAPAKQVPLRREVLDRVAELWVDYQLLAQAVARGDSLTDSATISAAAWPLIAQSLANQLHDSLVAAVVPTAAQVDSAFAAGDQRFVSHILVRVQGDTTPQALAGRRRQAEGYLAQLRGGADFGALARRVSEDPGSGPNGGNLGLVGRNMMVKPFEDAAFALEPGQLSDVVRTPFGFHVLWRPRLEQVRDSFTVALGETLRARFDSLYLDSLTNRTGISVRKGAPQLVRNAAGTLREAKGRSRTFASYHGGKLTEGEFARWLQAFPAQTRGMVLQADDSTLVDFVRSIARNEMLIEEARSRGVRLGTAEWDTIRTRYVQDLGQMLSAIGVAPESLDADTSAGGSGRQAAAARRVDAYLAAITSRQSARPYVEVPPFLGDALRARGRWTISASAVNRAVDRAKVLRGPEDPTAPPPGAMTPVPMQPAPGGPPLPQGGRD
jgi:peptidyl-prolyl cis-trans isomerase D